nr:hypothetical protein GCM10020093_000500 [Planobispora longispora]
MTQAEARPLPGTERPAHAVAAYPDPTTRGNTAMNILRTTTRHVDGRALVTVAGELDITTRPELCARVEHLLGTRPGTLVLDLGAVTFIDARGLSALVVLRRHAIEMGTRLLLSRVSPGALDPRDDRPEQVLPRLGGGRDPAVRPRRPPAATARGRGFRPIGLATGGGGHSLDP